MNKERKEREREEGKEEQLETIEGRVGDMELARRKKGRRGEERREVLVRMWRNWGVSCIVGRNLKCGK